MSGRLLAELRKVQNSEEAKPFIAEYKQCLRRAGYTANSRLELYESTLKKFPSPEQPWPQLAAASEWQQAVVAEQKAASADKSCRAKLYRWATGQIRPIATKFNTDTQVTAVQEGWKKIKADYVAAGL